MFTKTRNELSELQIAATKLLNAQAHLDTMRHLPSETAWQTPGYVGRRIRRDEAAEQLAALLNNA
jgi:hypothetical protein